VEKSHFKEVNVMDELKRKLVLLHHWRGLGWNGIFTILKADPHLSSFVKFSISELKDVIHLPQCSVPDESLQMDATYKLLEQYEQHGIFPITIFDNEYPKILKEIYQPPWVIYARGKVDLLRAEKKIAVVGTRQATSYGKAAIRAIFPDLIKQGFVIVSGLAKGIDAYSHETAIALGGNTIAVIAGGFFHIYPKENSMLAEKMFAEQLVISEYPPDTRPERWHFPLRNRIISGISLGTLVVEAKSKSGSLITANFALNEGREVFAVPGNILSQYSAGPNELIQQGAKLVKTASDITDELFLNKFE
jgi:DNA processing protein